LVSGRLRQVAASAAMPSSASSTKLARQPASWSSSPPTVGASMGATTNAMVM
jgi:hypothetical protein